jgi:hypothetical protein
MRILVVQKGIHMSKKVKLGTPADALSPESRAAANVKNNQQQYHLSHGASQKERSTELSEITGQSPQARAASRGVQNPPKHRLPNYSGKY